MAVQGESPAEIFQEVLPEISPLIGKGSNFTNVTNGLFGKKIITKQELTDITTKPNLSDDQRGSDVAFLLFDKINDASDDSQAVQRLMKICDVLESKTVNNELLKMHGETMRSKVQGATKIVQAPSATPAAAVQTTGSGLLDEEDVDKAVTVLKKVHFDATKWKDLGLKLGIIINTLKVIGAEKGDAYDYLRMTIVAWIKGEDNAENQKWTTLIEAVRETGHKAAADRIPEKLQTLYKITI